MTMQSILRRSLLVLALALATAATGTPAHAAGPMLLARARHHKRHRRHHRRHKKATAAKKAAPAATKASTPAKKKVVKKKERTGPASLSEMRRKSHDMTREARADRLRDKEISQLQKIIPKITGRSQKADLLFQLAELWWEKSKFVFFKEMDGYDKAYNAWIEATNKGEKLPEPKPAHRESDIYRQQAVQLYNKILTDYPNYPRDDEVLFNLAYNMYETDHKKEGVALYWQLIKKYPRSQFVPDAYLQMGEHFFNSNQVFKAQKAYQKALDTGEKRVANFAIYKLAWCDYNLGEYSAAQKKFYTVILAAEKAESENPKLRGKIQLKQEALRDLVLTYAMADQVDPAIKFYEQHAGKEAPKLISRLADTFFDNGKNDESIQVYRYLINRDPNAKGAPVWQAQIVKAYANLQNRQQVLAEMSRLVDLYGPNGPWAKANASDPAAVKGAYDLAESTQRELVTEYHQEAQKTKYAKTYRLAAEIYKRYLQKFYKSPHAYNLRFYYAEILYTLQNYEEAATQYLKVVKADPDGQYSLTAAYDALLAYEKLAAIDRGDLKLQKVSDKQKINENKAKGAVTYKATFRRATKEDTAEPIPKWEEKQIEASDAYVRIAADWKHKHAKALSKKKLKSLEGDEIVVRYKAAFLLYFHRHYGEAAKRFEHIILKWPEDKWAVKAADLILHSLDVKEQWAELNDLARKFRHNRRLIHNAPKDFVARLDTLIEGSAFKMVLDLNQQKKYVIAAKKFRAFVREFPKSKYADKALYNAMVIFDRAKKLDQAVTVGEKLLKNYGSSDLKPLVIQSLGSYYEQMADYQTAAHYYETYADDYLDPKGKDMKALPKDMQAKVKKTLPDNLFNAALWYEGLGNYGKAVANYLRYVKEFKDRKDVPDIYYNVALIYEQQKDYKREIDFLQSYVKDYGKKVPAWKIYRARYKTAEAYEKLDQHDDAVKVYEELAKSYAKLSEKEKKNPAVRDAVASSAFHLLQPEFDDYTAVKLDITKQRELQKRLTKKTKGLAKLEKDYTQVLTYGSGDWGIAALTQIGLGYQDFAKDLLAAPMPKGLSQDQQDMYRSILEEKAFPLQDKAIEAFEKALAKSYELGVYNEWTIKAQNDLLAFKPNAYGKIHKVAYFGSEFFIVAPVETSLKETPKVVAPPPPPPAKKTGVEHARRDSDDSTTAVAQR